MPWNGFSSPTARQRCPLPSGRAAAVVDAAGRAYRDARYSTVAENLPGLLARLHATTGPGRDVLLARAYAIASSLATKHGDDAIALAMADRARTHAQTSGDQRALTAATHVLAIALRRDGHHAAALRDLGARIGVR